MFKFFCVRVFESNANNVLLILTCFRTKPGVHDCEKVKTLTLVDTYSHLSSPNNRKRVSHPLITSPKDKCYKMK